MTASIWGSTTKADTSWRLQTKKCKTKDKETKHRVGLQAKTVAQELIRYGLTVVGVPAVICSDRGTQFAGAWLCMMCKYICVRPAKTVAYNSH